MFRFSLALLIPLAVSACSDESVEPGTQQAAGVRKVSTGADKEGDSAAETPQGQGTNGHSAGGTNGHAMEGTHGHGADQQGGGNEAERAEPEPVKIKGADGKLYAGTLADPILIDIDMIGAWEFVEKDQPFPDEVLALQGKKVRVLGFMMPDIDFENIRRFHLVRSLWGCCFGAPPRINEIIRVSVPDKGIDYTYEALEVIGTLNIVYENIDGLIEDLYRLDADSIREVDYDDPQAPSGFDPARDLQGIVPSASEY